MKINLYLFLSAAALLLLGSCKDIIEPDIDKRQVNLLAPGEAYLSKNYTVSFWWDPVEDASAYRLQIVSPKFDSIGALITDTLVKSNQFAFNLEPGSYQWRVRAENSGSLTPFSAPRGFSVLPSSIKQQAVLLGSPASGALVNNPSVSYRWGTVYGATLYRLQIDTNNFADTAKLVYNQIFPMQEAEFSLPKDQQYQWRVRAENDTAQSKWSAVRVVRYDHTPPGQVTLSAPTEAKVVPLPVALQWNTVSGASRYKLYVLKDSTALYGPGFPMLLNTSSYTFNLGASGDRIYWKVSALDAAGNEGPASKLQSFVLL
ncbi:hypothetical protein [Mucilaginibacter sp.]|jgi:hypothetical protein|uniref:hypothetical protein n=1 Tax=Mucilaginibacter sp. TaxID=1882438 RepID=UPI0035665B2B